MKKIVIFCVVINFIILFTISYTVFIDKNKVETLYLCDVENLSINDALDKLNKYDVKIINIESDKPKDTVCYTIPSKDRLTYRGQKVEVYVSTGIVYEQYKDLTKMYYSESLEYLEYLKNKYHINIIYKESTNNDYVDGLITSQSNYGVITEGEDLTLVVNSNKEIVLVPCFINKSYKVAEVFFYDKSIKVIYVFTKSAYPKNIIYSSTINKDTLVLANSNPIYFYVSTGIGD